MGWPKGRPHPSRGSKRPGWTNRGSFKPGNRPWNAGTKGQGLTGANRGTFGSASRPGGKPLRPIGAKYWNTHDNEVFVKVDQPSRYAGRYESQRRSAVESWRPERLVNFEAVHGPTPRGLQIRRLLPLCNCEPNLVLVTPGIGALLNNGRWTRPNLPWHDLPLDAGARLSAVIAAIAFANAMERRRSITVPCECGCGGRVKLHGNNNHRNQRNRFLPGHSSRLRGRAARTDTSPSPRTAPAGSATHQGASHRKTAHARATRGDRQHD
ncbi:MAG: hypothetical protein OXG35_22320 [Acidobacteria bacterium]|nr:hypothetical protein [Acidobacteriota bacterium]